MAWSDAGSSAPATACTSPTRSALRRSFSASAIAARAVSRRPPMLLH
ncbi:MAG: hypothetical protein ACRDTX_16320 [Pseudonocardiaceae bacterium]